ncbi:microtubule-associated protein 10 [Polyodon spathula]|uniref:microtubule-associated protein 10 n=1 Tax=Polyodon spathula TaxID=7913 RepID=UPI001B7F6E11|nr:microtubule-associated protein 10 [Polyodon spathula]
MADSDLTKETLFSLEVLVDFIKTETSTTERRVLVPAVAVRLLDFPTLLIYRGDKENQEEFFQEDLEREKGNVTSELFNQVGGGNGQYFFQKGKSCLFKISLDSLHRHLSNTPLYAMVLDLKNETPKLVGSCLISLAKLTEKISNDVKEHGISMPSFHGEKGVYIINNLMGEKVGYISLGYKLLSLGASLIPHISENTVLKVGSWQSMVQIKENTENGAHITEENKESKGKPKSDIEIGKCCKPQTNESSVLLQQIDLEGQVTQLIVSEPNHSEITSVGTQTEPARRKQYRNIEAKDDVESDNETGVFCPPALFYRCPDNEPNEYDPEQHRSINVGVEALMVEDLCSVEEEDLEDRDSSAERQALKCSHDRSEGCTAAAVAFEQTQPASAALGDAVRQLPLLNALLVELSLLNSQPQQLPLSVHPHLAWLYRSLDEHSRRATKVTRSRSQADAADTLQAPAVRRSASPRVKQQKSPVKSTSSSDLQKETRKVQRKNMKQEKNQKETASSSPKRKLLYGITNTLRLRLQQTNPDMLIYHERREVYRRKQIELQKAKNSKGFLSKNKKVRESNKVYDGGEMYSRSNHFDQNIQTLMNSLELDSPQIIKTNPSLFNSSEAGNRNKQEKGSQQEETGCYVNDQQQHESVPALNLKDRTKPGPRRNGRDVRVHIPRVFNQDSDQSCNEVENCETSFPHASLNNPGFQSTSLDGENVSPANSGFSSPAQKYSDDFIESPDLVGYSEDVTSPEPTSRYSVNFDSSPEPVPSSPRRMYSDDDSSIGSNSVRNQRATAPLPVLSDTSPEQSLKRTYPVMHHEKLLSSSVSSEASEIQFSSTDTKHKQEERKKLSYIKTGVKGAQRSLDYINKPNSRKGHEAVEESHSLQTSQVSSYLPTNDSDLDFIRHKVSTPDLHEEVEERDGLGTLEMGNKYHHISELVGNKLPGYTL